MKKRWVIGERDHALESYLSRELHIAPLVSRILINRGIKDVLSGNEFLSASCSSQIDPFLLNDMEKAAAFLIRAIHEKKRILIYGDYDVDGVTASALYLEFFRKLGAEADLYIPDRFREGYSLNEAAVHKARSSGFDIILTADCGTSSTGPIRLAQGLGMEVIVTDHHEPPEDLPQSFALINPARHDSTYPFRGLTGVGVAFKLAQAVSKMLEAQGQRSERHSLSSYLDLVALGTVADVAPLTGENRVFVKEGLALLTAEKRIGIAALKEVSGIAKGEVTGGTIGFILAPRINAAGRLSKAEKAVRMLVTRDPQEAKEIAASLDQMNQERQRLEGRIRDDVREKITREMDIHRDKVIVMASHEWHQGVIGIVASKVVDEFYRPCILISLQEDGSGKGSARSIPRFNIYNGLDACKDLLERFGGHKYAAGLTIKAENIPLLRERLSALFTERMEEEDLTPQIILDAEIGLDEISFPLLKEMTLLPPYGPANPEPVIVTKGLRIMEPRIVGKDHLKMKLQKGRIYLDSIGFNMGSSYNDIITSGREIDIAYTPELNLWKGTYGVQLRLKDIRPSFGFPLARE